METKMYYAHPHEKEYFEPTQDENGEWGGDCYFCDRQPDFWANRAEVAKNHSELWAKREIFDGNGDMHKNFDYFTEIFAKPENVSDVRTEYYDTPFFIEKNQYEDYWEIIAYEYEEREIYDED